MNVIEDDPHSKLSREKNDLTEFEETEPVTVALTLELPKGVWNWIRAKADYEEHSHEKVVAELLEEAMYWALAPERIEEQLRKFDDKVR